MNSIDSVAGMFPGYAALVTGGDMDLGTIEVVPYNPSTGDCVVGMGLITARDELRGATVAVYLAGAVEGDDPLLIKAATA